MDRYYSQSTCDGNRADEALTVNQAVIPSNLATNKIIITSASSGADPTIYLGASIAASAQEAAQSGCSTPNAPDCQSGIESALNTDNALGIEARFLPLLPYSALAALVSILVSYNFAENADSAARAFKFQSDAYSAMVTAQSAASVVFVTESNDPHPSTAAMTPVATSAGGSSSPDG